MNAELYTILHYLNCASKLECIIPFIFLITAELCRIWERPYLQNKTKNKYDWNVQTVKIAQK